MGREVGELGAGPGGVGGVDFEALAGAATAAAREAAKDAEGERLSRAAAEAKLKDSKQVRGRGEGPCALNFGARLSLNP